MHPPRRRKEPVRRQHHVWIYKAFGSDTITLAPKGRHGIPDRGSLRTVRGVSVLVRGEFHRDETDQFYSAGVAKIRRNPRYAKAPRTA